MHVADSTSNEKMTMRFHPGTYPKVKWEYLGKTDELTLDPQLYGRGYPFADVAAEIERILIKRRPSPRWNKNAWRRIATYMRSNDDFIAFMEGTQRVSSGRAAPRRWFSTTTPDELLPNSARKIFSGVYPAMVEADRETPFSHLYLEKSSNRRTELNRILKQLNIASAISASHLSPYHSAINILKTALQRSRQTSLMSGMVPRRLFP
jgi:hypothetical protein